MGECRRIYDNTGKTFAANEADVSDWKNSIKRAEEAARKADEANKILQKNINQEF